MNIRRRTRHALIAVVMGLGLLVPTAPAHAAISSCPKNHMCLWTQANFTGSVQKIKSTDGTRSVSLAGVKSYDNNRSNVTVITHKNGSSSTVVCLPARLKVSNVTGKATRTKTARLTLRATCASANRPGHVRA